MSGNDGPLVEDPPSASSNESKPVGFYKRVLFGPTGKMSMFVLLICLNIGSVYPLTPSILENHFASQSAGHTMHCQDYKDHDDWPHACKEASSKSSSLQIGCDSIACLITFFLAPSIGLWSDYYGRIPFLLPLSVMVGLPTVALTLHNFGASGLEAYFITSAISPLYIMLSVTTMFAADVLKPEDRAAGFGLILGGFGVGISLGPGFPLIFGTNGALIAGSCFALIAPLYVHLFVEETLALENRRENRVPFSNIFRNPFAPLRILGRNSLFRRLTFCVAILGICVDGTSKLDAYFFTDIFNMSSQDLSIGYVVVGVGTLLFQILLLKSAIGCFGERRVLSSSLAIVAAAKVGFFFVGLLEPSWKWFVYTYFGFLYPMALWAFPAVSAIKANAVGQDMQGAVQGALFGVKSLSQGLGPPVLAVVYSKCNGKHFPDHPSMTYLVLAFISVMGVLVSLCLPDPNGFEMLRPSPSKTASTDCECSETNFRNGDLSESKRGCSGETSTSDLTDRLLAADNADPEAATVQENPESISGGGGPQERAPPLRRGVSLFASI